MTTTHEAVTQYVVFRQAAGEDFRATARLLDAFCRAVGPDVAITDVPVERIGAFVDGRGPVTRYWRRKHSALRGLYRDALSHRLVEHAPLPSIIPKQGARPQKADRGWAEMHPPLCRHEISMAGKFLNGSGRSAPHREVRAD